MINIKYHNITKDDMLNGDGLRTVLWVSGCNHNCPDCQNPITHDPDGGLLFTELEKGEIFRELEHDYISGITFSGGDPLHSRNVQEVAMLCWEIKERFPDKTIWIYTGYLWEQIWNYSFIRDYVDVVVDGRFIEKLADVNYQWAGSTNQRVIDVKNTVKKGKVILWEKKQENSPVQFMSCTDGM